MSDPVGSVGVSQDQSDLTAIYKGGENFMARMQALVKLRDSQEEAYLKLQLGTDAKTALTQASEAKAAAVYLRDEADRHAKSAKECAAKIIDAANIQASAIVDKAETEAKLIIYNATSSVESAHTEAATVRSSADKYAQETRSAAEAVLSEAQEKHARADSRDQTLSILIKQCKDNAVAKNSELDAAIALHNEEAKKLVEAQAKVDGFHATLMKKHKRIAEFVEELGG